MLRSGRPNAKRLLANDEFSRRFLLHVLPKGFVRVRNFGFLANRRRDPFNMNCCVFIRRVVEQRYGFVCCTRSRPAFAHSSATVRYRCTLSFPTT
jgi:hypothetical protein